MGHLRPQIWKPAEDFAVDKSAETFGNVAFGAYKKFKDTAPVISIENPPAGGGLSRAEDLQNLVEASRKQFVKRAMAEGINKNTAEEQAKKLIGVTWDVGHINMIRKFGYSEEDTLKEAKKIAPFVKHVHLSGHGKCSYCGSHEAPRRKRIRSQKSHRSGKLVPALQDRSIPGNS